ncbi:hypothetical protein ACRYCC_28635 [Actinomadura scrupuli]|uniref:hypothetical protein n=1 Tax=Actinomadura scrupuli TaxID=559629 RepID=UPI003D97853B
MNALLDAAGSNAARCSLHDLYVSPIFALDKAEDGLRYTAGLPNKYDLLDTRGP